MDISISSKYVYQLSDAELKSCAQATLGDLGVMEEKLRRAQINKDRSRAFLAEDESGKLVAWALVTDYQAHQTAMFYTLPKYRRRGYATRLADEIVACEKDAVGAAHDLSSRSFFSTIPMIVHPYFD
jgi:predicted GNAT family acetyltransferase